MAGSPPKSPSRPPPFASHPSAAKLIESYLRPRVVSGAGAMVGELIVHEADLYAAGPDHLTGQFRAVTAGDGEKAWYFFTPLKFKSMLKIGIERAVRTGEGCWEEEEESPQPVLSDFGGRPAQMGLHQTLAFVRKEGVRVVRLGWFMVELRIDTTEPLAMCKVYRGDPKAIDAAGGKEPGAERGAASSGRQKTADVGERGGASTTRQASLDAADKGKAPAEAQKVEAPGPAVHAMDVFPSDAELINTYLRPWVDSGKNAGKFIHESDVYADAPDELARRFTPAVAGDGEKAWYFLTKLRRWGDKYVKRSVDSGSGKGTCWRPSQKRRTVLSDDGSSIGQSQTFAFTRKGKKEVRLGWMMVELRLNSSDPNALCQVCRSTAPKADGGSPGTAMAGAHGREDGEEIDSAAAAGPGLKRKAGDKGSDADTGAAPPGSQKKAVGESPGEPTTGLPLDAAAEEVEAPAEPEEPNDPSKPKLQNFF